MVQALTLGTRWTVGGKVAGIVSLQHGPKVRLRLGGSVAALVVAGIGPGLTELQRELP